MEILTDALFAVIGSAQQEVLAVTPYFVPPPEIVRAFRVAALRGVDVRLVLPRRNNHLYAGLAGRALYDDLLASGMRLFECPAPFIHAKALIVDDALAVVGTANLDVRSLRLNYETNIVVFDEAFSRELKRIVLNDLEASRELQLDRWRSRPAVHRILENACNLLTPIL
jgi:cardiolipin synthase